MQELIPRILTMRLETQTERGREIVECAMAQETVEDYHRGPELVLLEGYNILKRHLAESLKSPAKKSPITFLE